MRFRTRESFARLLALNLKNFSAGSPSPRFPRHGRVAGAVGQAPGRRPSPPSPATSGRRSARGQASTLAQGEGLPPAPSTTPRDRPSPGSTADTPQARRRTHGTVRDHYTTV